MVTNALNIAAELAVRANIELVVCGGSARSESYELVGPLAELTLRNINLDVAVIGVDGVSATAGLTTHHEVEAQTNRCLLRAAAQVVVVADSSKIGRRGFARISELGAVSDLVTDSDAKSADVEGLERAGAAGCTERGAASQRRSGSRARGAATIASASRQMSRTARVADVFGSTISACRTSSGRRSTAARTVRSTTERNVPVQRRALRAAGRRPPIGCTPSRVDHARHLDAALPSGRLAISPRLATLAWIVARRAGDHAVDHLRCVLGRVLLGLDVSPAASAVRVAVGTPRRWRR